MSGEGGVAAQEVAQALRAIARRNGGLLLPEKVLEAAEADPDSPLRPHFTWDDTEAAHKRRLDEARTLIRSVKVVTETATYTVETVAWVQNPNKQGNEPGYVSVESLRSRSKEDDARAVLVNEFKRIGAELMRARALAAVLGQEGTLDDLVARVETARMAAEQAPGREGPRKRPW